jgi:hypothetical protein
MEQQELFKRMISKVMKKDYPFIADVNVVADRDAMSYNIYGKFRTIYNVWFKLDDWGDFDDWEKFENTINEIKDSLGLGDAWVRVYYLENGSDDSYYRD